MEGDCFCFIIDSAIFLQWFPLGAGPFIDVHLYRGYQVGIGRWISRKLRVATSFSFAPFNRVPFTSPVFFIYQFKFIHLYLVGSHHVFIVQHAERFFDGQVKGYLGRNQIH